MIPKTKEDIFQLIDRQENAEVEFKSAKGGFPQSFWETFSAFANTNGGIILLGVKEKNGNISIEGLSDEQVKDYKKIFWDCAHNKQKVSATMLTEADIDEIEVERGKVLVFRIPRAPYDLRPVYLNKNPFENTYRRNYEGDYRCSESEVRIMITDANHTTRPYDALILPNFTIADIDLSTVRGYRQRFFLRKENHPWNELEDLEFLKKLGAYRVDRATGEEGFTRAGILVFGKGISINDESCTPNYFVDYQEKMSDNPHQRWTDRICPDGAWEHNLYQCFFRIYNRIGYTLRVPFKTEDGMRQEETSAHIAVREALVNALVHCNYEEKGSILIRREKRKISFRNPGCMLITVEQFYAGSRSICRNPTIQNMFVHLGYGEKAGSGADFILKGCSDNRWKRPEIIEGKKPHEVIVSFEIDDPDDFVPSPVVDENVPNCPQSDGVLSPVDDAVVPRCPQSDGVLSPVVDENVPSCPQSGGVLSPVDDAVVPSCPQSDGVLSPVGDENVPSCPQSDGDKKETALKALKNKELSISELMEKVGEKNKNRFRKNILTPLIDAGLIERTITDKPNSSKQKYRLR